MKKTFISSSKPDVIFRILRGYIAEGQWKNGEKLSSIAVAKMLGVGRSSVNEAMKRLVGRGFISVIPNVGFVVRNIDKEEIRAAADVRVSIMSIASRFLMKYVRDSGFESLRSKLDLVKSSYTIGAYDATISGLESYHIELFTHIAIPHLEDMLLNTEDMVYYCMKLCKLEKPEAILSFVSAEIFYLDALQNGDLLGCKKFVRTGMDALLNGLREKGGDAHEG